MRRITQTELQQLYAPMPEQFVNRMEGLLASRPAGKEKTVMRKKISMAIAVAVLFALLTAGAVAAANWDAIRFLYAGEKPQLERLLTPVNQKGTAGGVTLEVASAITDGYAMVLDWTLRPDSQALPLYVQMEEMLVNGEVHRSTMPDSLFRRWLTEGESICQGGEVLLLDQPAQAGDTLHVEVKLGVYQPKGEIVVFDTMTKHDQALELAQQGVWVVEPEHEVNLAQVDENNKHIKRLHWAYPLGTDEDLRRFDRSEIILTFDVPVSDAVQNVQQLHAAQSSFEDDSCAVEITRAVRTAMGVYATVDIMTKTPEKADDMDEIDLLCAYYLSLSAPWDEYLYGTQLIKGTGITTDAEGRQHRSMTCALLAYQEPVMEDMEAVQMNIYTSQGVQQMRRFETFLYQEEEAMDGVSYTKDLRPTQESYDTPLYTARFASISKNAHRDVTFELLLYPKAPFTAEEMAGVLKLANGEASDLHYTAQVDADEDGRSCVKVHGSLLLPFKQPETDVLSVQCSIGEDVQLLSFYLYDGE